VEGRQAVIDIVLSEAEAWNNDGAQCQDVGLAHLEPYRDGSLRHGGELIWSPCARAPSGSYPDGLLPGWNVWADYDDLGRLAPNLYKTRILGVRTLRGAIRALLAQMVVNRKAYDAWSADRQEKAEAEASLFLQGSCKRTRSR
jgi:hypothetical protein